MKTTIATTFVIWTIKEFGGSLVKEFVIKPAVDAVKKAAISGCRKIRLCD